MPNIYKKII